MAAKTPTEMLSEEHRFVSRAVAALVVLADRLETGREVKAEFLRDAVAFMRLVAETHEKKEEIYLFPALQRRGVSVQSVPTRSLVEQHQRGKVLVASLEEAAARYGDAIPSEGEAVVASLRGLAALYPLHIWQEDLLLFHQADGALTREDNEELLRAFNSADQAAGWDVRGRLEQMAQKVERHAW